MLKKKSESGQSIVIIAIMFLGLLAIAALVIDGGSLYLNRRNAQTAADAAAMAGAHELCVNNATTDGPINTIATQYAVAQNGATGVTVTVTRPVAHPRLGTVDVTTTLTTSSFFARFLGFQNDQVTAEASAGCFPPSTTKNLLPISWACQPPVGGGTPGSACTIESIPYNVFKDILLHYGSLMAEGGSLTLNQGDGVNYATYNNSLISNKMTYLIMDTSTQTTAICASPFGTGLINCDWNNDGNPELSGGGDRGWLALDGGGAAALKDIIVNGYSGSLTLPEWFPTKAGGDQSVFLAAKGSLENKLVWVPVYNAFCVGTNDTTLKTDCLTKGWQDGDNIASGGGATYYRVAGFAPFVATCISTHKNQTCPAKTLAGLTKANGLDDVSKIEGYFVSGLSAGTAIEPGGFDLGVYVISLTK